MTTTVKFGPYLKAALSVASRIVIAPKGTLDLAKLPSIKAAEPFSTLDANVTAPLRLKEGGVSSVTLWHKHGECTLTSCPSLLVLTRSSHGTKRL